MGNTGNDQGGVRGGQGADDTSPLKKGHISLTTLRKRSDALPREQRSTVLGRASSRREILFGRREINWKAYLGDGEEGRFS